MKYAFYCSDCGKITEEEISLSDYPSKAPKVCKQCGSPGIRRYYYPVNIIYKSEGFTKRTVNDDGNSGEPD